MKRLLLLAIFLVSILLGLPGVTNAEYDPCKIVRDETESYYQHLIGLYGVGAYKEAEYVAKKIIDCMEYKDARELYNAIQSRLSGDEVAAREWEAKGNAKLEATERERKAKWVATERERKAKWEATERERKAALIEKLDKEVRAIPADQAEKNLELYKRLLELDPDNPRYKSKVAYYSKRFVEKREKARKAEERYIRHYNYENTNDYTVGIGFYASDMKSLPKEARENYIGVLYLNIYAHRSCNVWGNFQLQQGTILYNPNQFLSEIYRKNYSLKPGVIEPVIILIPNYLDVRKPITIWIDDDTKKEFILTDFPHK